MAIAQAARAESPPPFPLHFEHRYVPCNLCGSQDWELVAEKDRHGKALHTVICRDCGLVYTNPMPTTDAIMHYYSQEYRADYKGVTQPKFKHVYRAGHMALERLARIKDLLHKDATLVDVGFGGGEFVYLIHKLGLNAWGVEPNEGYAEYARREYDLPIQAGFWQTAEFAPETVDVITAHHVLEHFEDPQAALHEFSRWLKRGGYLMIDVPNVEEDNHAPENKFHFAHLYNFSPYTLQMLAAKAGFEKAEEGISIGTVMVFCKTGTVCTDVKSKDNYARVHAIATQRTAFSDVIKCRNASDLLRRLRKQLHEKAFVRRYSRGKEILDAVYAHIPPLTR